MSVLEASLDALDGNGSAATGAMADGGEPKTLVVLMKSVDECGDDASAGSSDGVTKGDTAAMNVELIIRHV